MLCVVYFCGRGLFWLGSRVAQLCLSVSANAHARTRARTHTHTHTHTHTRAHTHTLRSGPSPSAVETGCSGGRSGLNVSDLWEIGNQTHVFVSEFPGRSTCSGRFLTGQIWEILFLWYLLTGLLLMCTLDFYWKQFNLLSSVTYYCITPQWNTELIVSSPPYITFLLFTSVSLSPPLPQEHDQVFLLSQSAAGRLVCVRGVVRGGKIKTLSTTTSLNSANSLKCWW